MSAQRESKAAEIFSESAGYAGYAIQNINKEKEREESENETVSAAVVGPIRRQR